ncbi:MAG TPA: serine hydrolase domain-containing protein [Thermoanaerobaculia bacterium]|jgi:CubicO group peptidase (beta-lactamase class C family)|nr:serine hydrolase domain-containing protein [Thermoanaerobaculia bacterium]
MHPLVAILVGLLLSVAATAQELSRPEDVGISSSRLERARGVLQTAIDAKVAGSAVGLIARDGKLVFFEAFGEMEPGVPMTRDAISRMSSIGKTITAVAVLMLYEEGRLRLSDPVSRFIPELGKVQVETKRTAAGGSSLAALDRPITIHDLLTHEAGLAADGAALDKLWEKARTVGEFAQGLAQIPLRFQPGTRYEYGPSYEVLAAVVERASGMSFKDFLERRILSPLGMRDTTFFVPEEKRSRYAGIYQKDANGKLSMFRRRGQEEAPTQFTPGGGGLRGTVYDYYRFAQMLLNGGELNGQRLLSPKTVELMTSDHIGEHAVSSSGDFGWGLGTSVRTRVRGAGIGSVGSYGWNGGTGTLYLVDPRERLIVVVFVPSQPRTPGIWGQTNVRDDFVTAAYQAIIESHRMRP